MCKNTSSTRFGKSEPKDRCTNRKIQTAINVNTCKRYTLGKAEKTYKTVEEEEDEEEEEIDEEEEQ